MTGRHGLVLSRLAPLWARRHWHFLALDCRAGKDQVSRTQAIVAVLRGILPYSLTRVADDGPSELLVSTTVKERETPLTRR